MASFAEVAVMRYAVISLFLGVSAAVLVSAEAPLPLPALPACAASPRQDWLPKVIAPSAGARPIWFVDGGGGTWQGVDVPVKSAWILDRTATGPLRVTGRQIQNGQTLTFREGMNGPITSSLLIETPLAHSMTPGGASAEVMRELAFVSSYVFYPSPGCWELTAQVGNEQVKIVVDLRQR
jgi:hypothetical protein